MSETPKCKRCGRTVPKERRPYSDYCTKTCQRRHQWEEDEEYLNTLAAEHVTIISKAEADRVLARAAQPGEVGK